MQLQFQPWLTASPSGRYRDDVEAILTAAVAAVEPASAVRAALRQTGARLIAGSREYDLDSYQRIYVVGAGKAGAPMVAAVESLLGDRSLAGSVNVKTGYVTPTSHVRLIEAGHPVPDEAGVEGTRAQLELLAQATERDLVLVLLSGGGSALLTLPAGDLTLADLQATTGALLRSGAPIGELNAVRKHLDAIKGGQLTRHAAPADLLALVISDVVGSPLDVIASGPTAPDPSTYADARSILRRRGVWDTIPERVRRRLERGVAGELPETPTTGDPIFERVHTLVIAANAQAAAAAREMALVRGYHSHVLTTYVEGEAREVGKVAAALAKELAVGSGTWPRPACLILGGETTVTVRGSGRGGRNQELALAAALALEGVLGVAVLAFATDGSDGPTDAAGALADGTTLTRARALGLDTEAALANNDAYAFFAGLGDLLLTGPTNTNVNDLLFVFAFPPAT